MPVVGTTSRYTSKSVTLFCSGLLPFGLLLILSFPSCTARMQGPGSSLESALPQSASTRAGLEIALRFDAQADLDLFVTGPDLETVYFGNNPNRAGATLSGDERCGSGEPRVERVKFATPMPGAYRVGIEYAKSCKFRSQPANYHIHIRAEGLEIERAGSLSPGRFDSRAIEFEFRPDPSL